MKILLVCAGGYSTSILMKKVRDYTAKNGLDVQIDAVGANMEEEEMKRDALNADVLMVAPQIRYKKDEIAQIVSIPVIAIPPMDYGAGKPERIIQLAQDAMKG